MLTITKIFMDGGLLGRDRIADNQEPVFSWSLSSTKNDNKQLSCSLEVSLDGVSLWNSGWVETEKQQMKYAGKPLPAGRNLTLTVTVCDRYHQVSPAVTRTFVMGVLKQWDAKWIIPQTDDDRMAIYFRRDFTAKKEIDSATLYVCGVGYHEVYINGQRTDDTVLSPATSNYVKTSYYQVLPDVGALLNQGENTVGIILADGWRNNVAPFYEWALGGRKIEFMGRPTLTAMLEIRYADGKTEKITTDEKWSWKHGAITMNSIFDGETYDARQDDPDWMKPGVTPRGFSPAEVWEGLPCHMVPMALEPIREQEIWNAIDMVSTAEDTYIIDFGQNIAGVPRVNLPATMKPRQTVTVSFAEDIDGNGELITNILRSAKQTDTYIASGDGRDLAVWQPRFTYHGGRYARVTGLPGLSKSDIQMVALHTDMQSESHFDCGSALITRIHHDAVMTEKDNIHSIMTDCPQRDERMAWMNDATVRFEESPYNLRIGRMFPKIVRDIRNEQRPEGQFTCCSPFTFGALPADPVCSSYLVAGYEALMHTGNREIIAESFEGFAAWENYLLSRSDDFIVNYSYYGDWAAPAYAVIGEDGAVNSETPGILMSTGYSYLNCKLLARFADILGKTEEKAKYETLCEKIADAFLRKWWHEESAKVDKGSQGAQSFALWLGILPEPSRQNAADVLHADLVAHNHQFTTGNLCTRYMMDMLTKYGYIEDAWKILTSETYPSYGYMIQNEATTIWERFELKKNPEMNSHNHPMYGAVDYWFYAYLCGIQVTEPGFTRCAVHPYYPANLLSAHAVADTVMGDLSVRWNKRYGQLNLEVSVPVGMTADITVNDRVETVGSGFHVYHWAI